MSPKELKPTTKFFTSKGILPDEVVIKNNKWTYLIITLTMSFSLVAFGFAFKMQIDSWVQIFFVGLFLTLGIIGLKNLLDSRPQLKLNINGIYIRSKGFFYWSEIRETLIENQFDSDGSFHYLVLKLKDKRKIRTLVSLLSKDVDWIADRIEGYKTKSLQKN